MRKLILLFALVSIVVTHTLSSFSPNSVVDEERRKKITQAILDNLINEKYEDVRKDFHVSLKQTLPVEKISEVWTQMISINGSFQKVISVTPGTVNSYNQIRMRCQFKNDNATLETIFNEEDKVIGLWLKP